MIIDAHNHADWHGHNFDRFIKNMDDNNIDVTWLLTWECMLNECAPETFSCFSSQGSPGPVPLDRCISYKEKAPERFILGYAPDPRRPEAIAALSSAIDIYNVKVYGELKLRMMYDNPDAIRLFRFCGEKGLPVVMHFDYEFSSSSKYPWPNWWYGGGIDVLERVLAACPGTNFLGHAPGFWSHISADEQHDKVAYPKGKVIPGGKIQQLLRRYPNLYCDISAGSGHNALSRDMEHAIDFIDEFQDRIVYARDYFDSKHRQFLDSLGLSQSILNKIYYLNAVKLVPI